MSSTGDEIVSALEAGERMPALHAGRAEMNRMLREDGRTIRSTFLDPTVAADQDRDDATGQFVASGAGLDQGARGSGGPVPDNRPASEQMTSKLRAMFFGSDGDGHE